MAQQVVFELVAPERLLLSREVEMVVVPGAEGDFAVLAGHAPLISSLRPGAIEIYEGDRISDRFFVNGGFAEVAADRLTVLAEEAVPLAELDQARLDQSIKDAREDFDDAKSDEDRAQIQEKLDQLQLIRELL